MTTQPDGATGPADAAAPASSSSDRLSTDRHIGPVLFSAEQLAQRIALLGAQVTEDYEGRAPLLVGVLRGAEAGQVRVELEGQVLQLALDDVDRAKLIPEL